MGSKSLFTIILFSLVTYHSSFSQCSIESNLDYQCEGVEIQFKVQSHLNYSKVKWIFASKDSFYTAQSQVYYQFDTFGIVPVCAVLFDSNNNQVCVPSCKVMTIYNLPVADFDTAISPEVCAPQPVKFFNRTRCNDSIVWWRWDFNDNSANNSFSYLKNPTHTYVRNGIFTTCLTSSSKRGCRDSICKPDYVRIIGPEPRFWLYRNGEKSYSDTICIGGYITVLDSSEFTTGWQFVKGDATVFSDTNRPANHQWALQYKKPGTYKIFLNASTKVYFPTPPPGYWGDCSSTLGDTRYNKNDPEFVVVVRDSVSSINAESNENRLRIYPNPVQNELKIECKNGQLKKISVYNSFGRLYCELFSGNQPVQIISKSQLPSGFVILKIETENESRVIKVLNQ